MPDPTGRHQLRYWSGAQWIDHVATNGVQSSDPFAQAQAPAAAPMPAAMPSPMPSEPMSSEQSGAGPTPLGPTDRPMPPFQGPSS
jgi:hypothetical protein